MLLLLLGVKMKKIILLFIIFIAFCLVAENSFITKKDFADSIKVIVQETKIDPKEFKSDPIPTIINSVVLIVLVLGALYIYFSKKFPQIGRGNEEEPINKFVNKMDSNFRQFDSIIRDNIKVIENNTRIITEMKQLIIEQTKALYEMKGKLNGHLNK